MIPQDETPMTDSEIIENLASKVAEADNALEFSANMQTAEIVLKKFHKAKKVKSLHMSVIKRALEIKPVLALQYVELVKTIDARPVGGVN